MSKPSRLNQLIASVTEDVVAHPNDLTRHYMGNLNISRVGANNYIKQLEEKGWIEPEWGQSDKGRRAKFYSLTKEGRKQLTAERQTWDRVALAISDVLGNA